MIRKILTILTLVLFTASFIYAAAPDKKTMDKYYKAGVQSLNKNDFAKAYKYFSFIVKNDKNNLNAVLGLADCLVFYKKYDAALDYYARYTAARPNDAKAAEKMAACRQLSASELDALMPVEPENAAYVFKQPSTAIMYSHLDFMPFLHFFPLFGMSYASTKEQVQNEFKWQLIPSLAGDALLVPGLIFLYLSSNDETSGAMDYRSLSAMMFEISLSLTGISIALDTGLSPFRAAENTVKYINYNREYGFFPAQESGPLSYKEPLLASLLSFMAPGGGFFYAGKIDKGLSNLLFGMGANALAYIGGYAIGGGFEGNPNGMVSALGWLSFINFSCRIHEAYDVAENVDVMNREYYRQLVCMNSPYRIKRDREPKDPLMAFALAATVGLAVPGMGNFYIENWQGGIALAAERIIGGALFAAFYTEDHEFFLGTFLKYTGLTIAALTYVYDVLSAPGNAEIYNAVYTGAKTKAGKVTMIPSITPDGFGLNVAYSF